MCKTLQRMRIRRRLRILSASESATRMPLGVTTVGASDADRGLSEALPASVDCRLRSWPARRHVVGERAFVNVRAESAIGKGGSGA
jgi:hypothetical protein